MLGFHSINQVPNKGIIAILYKSTKKEKIGKAYRKDFFIFCRYQIIFSITSGFFHSRQNK
ncbi:hypothetical protein D7D25_17130 [Proteiniphilum sp. X52]|nr:hypothetical protein D7D25_17130 [Proteiniphilum sp. X52]